MNTFLLSLKNTFLNGIVVFLMLCSVGMMGQTITIDLASAGGSANLGINSYGGTSDSNRPERTWTQNLVSFGSKATTAATNPNVGAIQAQANNGVLYNTTAIPGRITGVTITSWSGSISRASTLYVGNSRIVNSTTGDYNIGSSTDLGGSNPGTWNIASGDYTYFAIKRTSSSAAYWSTIVITYELGKTVTFNANGGTGTMANQVATTATNLTTNTFIRTGYTFNGWNTAANGTGTSYANNESFPFTASATLYAKWTPNHVITFANLQFPGTGSISEGGTFDIFGEVFALGLTEAPDQGAGITAEFGYSTSNTDPSTWISNWQAATFSVQKGNNDEYRTTFSGLPIGTFYYATRFRYGTEPWEYGGYNTNVPTAGGTWNGVANYSGVLTVNSNVVGFANVQSPFNGTIMQGDNFSVYAKTYKLGFTEAAGANATITAWVGYSTTNATVSTDFNNASWTWVPATFNTQIGNDDEYVANIAGALVPKGIYYYVSRFKVTGSTEFKYGGINNNFWTIPGNSGVLTITKPTVVLTPTTLSGFNYVGAAGPSTQQTFTASGTELIADVLISAPTNYEVSTTSGTGFVNSVILTQSSGVVTSTTVYVRLKAGLTSGTYNQILTATSTSAIDKTVTLNGSVTAAASPNNGLALVACIANNQITLKWTAATGTPTPTGYIVFALPGTSVPQMAAASAGNASSYSANTDYSAPLTYTTLGKAVYKGSATTATITGLNNLSPYTFKVVAYNSEAGTGWATGINLSGSYNQTFTIDVPEITSLAATINPNSSSISWNVVPNSSLCYEYMIVANAGAVVFTPTGDGSAYAANPVLTGANQVVYKGTGNGIVVTGLTEGVNYCYKVFVRETTSGNQWSDGTSVCKITGVVYCDSAGLLNDLTGITSVVFNTINQTSPSTNAYTDFTSVSTNVFLGATHNLTVKVNTDGFRNASKAWIDWNKDGDFNDNGEEYDLGNAYTGIDIITSNSPLSITVPSNANLGTTRMRIATQYFDDIAPINFSIILAPCATYNYGEVEDYTINVTKPLLAEINIKGGSISIANGFDAPFGLNNTLFGPTSLNTDSVEKIFTIENVGITNLSLTGTPIIKIEGINPLDFIVTQQAITPVINGTPTTFKIKFNPTAAGTRSATVRIENNDSDENPYLFTIEGTGVCTVTPSITVFPISGPVNTLVSFTSSTSNLIGASVNYNNISLPIVSATSDKIEVIIPANANDGNFVIQLVNGCGKTQAFDVIDTQLTSCDASASGGSNASGLIIYEVYDENGGVGGVVTIYNRTGAAVSLAGYSIKRAPTYGGTYSTYANLSGTIASGAVAVIGVSSSPCGYATTGNGSFGSSGFNADDGFQLFKGAILIDDVKTPNFKGYYLKRKNTNLNPNILYNNLEWNTQSVAVAECLTGVGTQPILKLPPTVTLSGQYLINCAIKSTSLSVAGTEGFVGGLPLAYQWYVLGIAGNWTVINNGSIYSGATSATLNISDITGLDDYQYYCQIRENGISCYAATTASILRITKKTWNGLTWSGDGISPTFTQKAIITGSYNSATNGGDIKACECEVTAAGTINMNSGHTLDIQGAINNAGIINILNSGSLVQRDNTAINTGNISMLRDSKPMLRQDYTYWSSPIFGDNNDAVALGEFTLFNLSNFTSPTKYFKWDENAVPQKWVSLIRETTSMIPGRGYIVRAPSTVAFPTVGTPGIFTANFIGKPNNGIITTPVKGSITEVEVDYKWNLIGNPYPSAISAELFLSPNMIVGSEVVAGTLYFWTHNTPLNPSTVLGYATNDYASWNRTGGVLTAAATSVSGLSNNYAIPNGYIAAGQSFFIRGTTAGISTVTFNNSMRVDGTAGKNNQFFRTATETTTTEKHRVWLNLTGTQNAFNQTLVGYVNDATNEYDLRFDGESFGGNKVTFYSVLATKNLVIQGRALPFSNLDTVPLGYNTTLTGNLTISIDHVDGLMETQGIYLKDNLLNVEHDLKASNYTFATVPGTFNSRFVLRYMPEAQLGNPSFEQQVKGVRIYKNNATLNVSSPYETIATVSVYDIAGRLVFEQKDCNTNRFENNTLFATPQALIVKVTLKNGEVVTEKVL